MTVPVYQPYDYGHLRPGPPQQAGAHIVVQTRGPASTCDILILFDGQHRVAWTAVRDETEERREVEAVTPWVQALVHDARARRSERAIWEASAAEDCRPEADPDDGLPPEACAQLATLREQQRQAEVNALYALPSATTEELPTGWSISPYVGELPDRSGIYNAGNALRKVQQRQAAR